MNPPSRALKTPRRGVFARRDAERRARAVQIHQRSLAQLIIMFNIKRNEILLEKYLVLSECDKKDTQHFK